MPFVLLALLGLGLYIAKTRGTPAGSVPAGLVTRDAHGILVGTKDGSTLALLRLLRYGPAAPVVGGAPIGPSTAIAVAKKAFLGTLGTPGQPPRRISETAVGWVQDQALAGQYVFLRKELFGPTSLPAGLPATTTLIAVDPTDPPTPETQLTALETPDGGWVLLGDPAALAAQAPTWPDTVADFISLG